MKKLTLLFLLSIIGYSGFSQSVMIPQVMPTALTDLIAKPGTDKSQISVNGLVTNGDSNPGTYRWDAASTATPDGFIVLQATGVSTGRWIRVPSSNILSGTFSGTAGGILSTFNVPFGTTLPFTPTKVFVEAKTANATNHFIAAGAITNTGFTISFNTIPLSGTLTVDWIAIKQ